MLVSIVAMVFVTMSLFAGSFKSYVPVTLTSDRAGLVMESGGKVKLRGVQVGRVERIASAPEQVSLRLQIDPDKVRFIPANVEAQIRATSVFGAKYVDLVYPEDPSAARLAAGAVLRSRNVTSEVNTVFGNLVELLDHIDPAKLNAVLTALAEGVGGQGERIGQATSDANTVLLALNARQDKLREDWRSLQGFSDAYGGAARNIVTVLDAMSTTGTTLTTHSEALNSLLLNTIGFSRSGTQLLGPNKDNFIQAFNKLEPTTGLLHKYNPVYTCTLVGAKWYLENGGYEGAGGANGKSTILDTGLLLGSDPYRYPDNLPIVGAKGGPGGKPSCGSLPKADDNFPVRALVTNTGWGTGLDIRPNPGIGFPGWANYFPTTRGVPEPPSIRNLFGGPAPGPNAGNPPPVFPAPGSWPYGAPMYAPDGSPLWTGLPPAPPPGAPKDDGPRLGTEPFTVPHPGALPTPLPPTPLPVPAVPSP